MSQIQSTRNLLKGSMIRQDKQGSILVRCISAVDIFSFIPVPKSRPVSTKCSLIGTAIFFIIFFSYIIYDLITFIKDNPPLPNSYYESLKQNNYTAPKFSMVFMAGQDLDQGINPQKIFNYTIQQNYKKQKQSSKNVTNFSNCNESETRQWMGNHTFQNYKQNLQCPKNDFPLFIGGLLYVYEYAYNPAIKIAQCTYNSQWCFPNRTQIQVLQSKGRMFLFIQKNQGSQFDQESQHEGNYMLFNFFLIQDTYKRINIQFQVNKQILLPDYLTRWTQTESTWLEMVSSGEVESNVVPINNSSSSNERALLASIEFTLNPSIKVTKVAYSTLIDHIAQWGALWGVEFAIFAIFFLSYNSRKYYKKNPKWEKYDENQNEQNLFYTDEKQK